MASMDRRTFLKMTTAAAPAMVVSRHLLGGTGYTAPSDKLNIAAIGAAGRGASDLQEMETENIIALCDVDWDHAAASFQRYPDARRYRDFRIMLEKEPEIDAVVVATPDHVHAVAAMAAIKRGKHVYCEKPLTHNIAEARQLTRAARDAGVVTQMGIQGHAMESARQVCEMIWDGAIGAVREVHAWTPHPVWPQGIPRPTETPTVPETLSWDLWLGPAPYRPYHPAYVPALWRGWWDFGTGGLGDMGCHIFDPIAWALHLGPPETVEAHHSYFVPTMTWDKPEDHDSYPRASVVYYQFPAREGFPPLRLVWYDGGLMPQRPAELEPGRKMGDTYGGILFLGDEGTILSGSHGARGARIIPESRMQAYGKPPQQLPRSIGHQQEWIAACKGDGEALANFDYAGPLTETVLLGNISLWTGEQIAWDADRMRITNVPEANELLMREYREGWVL